MKRILHIVDSMDIGGAQVFIMNLYRNIDRNKVQFDFLVTDSTECAFEKEIKLLGGNIYSVSSRRRGILRNRKELQDFFENHKYECVHLHTSCPSYIEPLIIAKKSGVKKRIIHSHSSNGAKGIYHEMMRMIHRPKIKYIATNYYACSKLASQWMYKNFIRSEKIEIIPNAINLDKFIYNEKMRVEIREKLGISNSKFVIGHVGRFSEVKNHEFLIDIFNEIVKKNDDSILILIGDGSFFKKIDNKVKKYNLSEHVIFLGNKDNVNELMQAMDVFVMPSLYEGLPLTIVEAQASGLPCVISSAISDEVKLSDLIEFISLDRDCSYWSNRIVHNGIKSNRSNYNNILKKSGFDIHEVCKKLELIYIS